MDKIPQDFNKQVIAEIGVQVGCQLSTIRVLEQIMFYSSKEAKAGHD